MTLEEEILQIYVRLASLAENINSITRILDQIVERLDKLEAK